MAALPKLDQFCKEARRMGALDAVVISPKQVFTATWVRLRCQYGCPAYGQCLTCPPHSPTPETTAKMLGEYHAAILLHGSVWKQMRQIAQALERQAFLAGYYKAFALLCGPCDHCKTCVVEQRKTERPVACKHTDLARPAMEAAGIDVFATARAAGLPINVVRTEEDRPDYYTLVLVE
jgi:predicted metal-binding protein